MDGIFISYRRDDSAGYAGRLYDRLVGHFGPQRVFMDVEGIAPGMDFVEAIENAVASCRVLIVMIGDEWTSAQDAAGRRRLDDPHDFIRLETGAALRRNIRVVPVLVGGAVMPRAEELPEDLRSLTRRQAIEINHKQWDASSGQLIKALEAILTLAAPASAIAAAQATQAAPAPVPAPQPVPVLQPVPVPQPDAPVRPTPGDPLPAPPAVASSGGTGPRVRAARASVITLSLALSGMALLAVWWWASKRQPAVPQRETPVAGAPAPTASTSQQASAQRPIGTSASGPAPSVPAPGGPAPSVPAPAGPAPTDTAASTAATPAAPPAPPVRQQPPATAPAVSAQTAKPAAPDAPAVAAIPSPAPSAAAPRSSTETTPTAPAAATAPSALPAAPGPAPVIRSFTAEPSAARVRLCYSVSHAAGVDIAPRPGAMARVDKDCVSAPLDGPAIFTLTARNANESVRRRLAVVPPPAAQGRVSASGSASGPPVSSAPPPVSAAAAPEAAPTAVPTARPREPVAPAPVAPSTAVATARPPEPVTPAPVAPSTAVAVARPPEPAAPVAAAPPATSDRGTGNSNSALPTVGERWLYRSSGKWPTSPRRRIEFTVRSVAGSVVTDALQVLEPETAGGAELRRSRGDKPDFIGWNAIGPEFSPYFGAFVELQRQSPQSGLPTPPIETAWTGWESQFALRGTESVTVPAGTFQAMKVEIWSNRRRTGSDTEARVEPVRVHYLVWYAPQVKRYIRMQRRVTTASSSESEKDVFELLSYQRP